MTELDGGDADRLLTELDVSWNGHDWRSRTVQLLTDYIDLLIRQPGLARSMLVVTPRGPRYLDATNLVLLALLTGGLPPKRAAWAADLLLRWCTAAAAVSSTDVEAGRQALDQLEHTLNTVETSRHLALAAVGAAHMTSGDGPQRRAWFLDVLIDGVLARPVPDESEGGGW